MQVGKGTTGNSTGNLYVTVDEHLSVIRKKWNSDVMKSVVDSRSSALNLIEETVKRFNIDCDFVRTSFNFFAETLDEDIQKFMEDEFQALEECGLKPVISDNAGMTF